jgi:hypothetical protein
VALKSDGKKTALLMLIFLATASPELADDSLITCATVRAYVSQVGFVQAKAQARAVGLTERRSNGEQCSALRIRTDVH